MQDGTNSPPDTGRKKSSRKQKSNQHELELKLDQLVLDYYNGGFDFYKLAKSFESLSKEASKFKDIVLKSNTYRVDILGHKSKPEIVGAQNAKKMKIEWGKAAKLAVKKSDKAEPDNLLGLSHKIVVDLKKQIKDKEQRVKEIDAQQKKLLDKEAVTFEDHHAQALLLESFEGTEAEIKKYEDISKVLPHMTDFRVFFHLGQAYDEGGRVEEAISAFEQAYKLEPRFVKALYHIAFVLKEQGEDLSAEGRQEEAKAKYKEAEDKLKESIALREKHKLPADNQTYYTLTETLTLQGKHEEALAIDKQCIKLFPDDPNWYDGIATSLTFLAYNGSPNKDKLLTEALQYIDKALKIAGDEIFLLVRKANVLNIKGDDHEALLVLNYTNGLLQRNKDSQDQLAELKGTNKAFAERMLTQDRQLLLEKVTKIEEEKFTPIAIDDSAEDFQKEYAEEVNKEMALVSPHAEEYKHNAVKAIAGEGDIEQQSEVILKINMMFDLMNKRCAQEIFRSYKDSNPHLSDYLHGVSMTLTSTFTAAQGAAAGLKVDAASMMSDAVGMASILPFGGGLFSMIQGAMEARQEVKKVSQFSNYSKYASNPMESSLHAMEVCNKLASNYGSVILSMKPKKGAIKKLCETVKKLLADGEAYTYDDPWKMLGHTQASILVKEMSKNQKKSEIKTTPYETLSERMFKFIAEHAFKGKDLSPGIAYMQLEVEIALGEKSAIDFDAADFS